jgi:uncharacterized protein DUF4349
MRRSWCAAVLAALVMLAGCTGTAKSGGPQGMAAADGGAQSAAGAGVDASPRPGNAVPAPRSLVKTAALTVRVTDVDAQADRAIGIAIAAGGDVLADQRSGSGGRASAELTLEVPPATLEPQLRRLARLGEQVNRVSSTDDVTQQVVDVNSRLGSLRASLARVRALYAQATSISDVIKLESELASREANLESLEAQQHDLALDTARAKITLQLLAMRAPAPASRRVGSGMGAGFARGWHALVASVRWTVGAFGTLLPFLLLAGALAALGLWWRRRAHAGAPTSPPS